MMPPRGAQLRWPAFLVTVKVSPHGPGRHVRPRFVGTIDRRSLAQSGDATAWNPFRPVV